MTKRPSGPRHKPENEADAKAMKLLASLRQHFKGLPIGAVGISRLALKRMIERRQAQKEKPDD